MKRLLFIISALILIFSLVTCGSQNPQKTISRELGIDVSGGKITAHSDTHGGFQGDGTTFIALEFTGDEVLEQISENGQWKPFPLDDTANALLYGTFHDIARSGPYVVDGEGNPLVPDIQDGYYRLIDRHTDAGKGEEDILHRFSFNFTLAIFDTGTNTLYFCKLDT